MGRHYPNILRFFEAKVPHAAEDLTQQAFLDCVEGRARIREGGSFRAYLFAIARHGLLDHLRSSDRMQRMISFREAQPVASVVTPSRVVAMVQEQRLLLRALDKLPPDLSVALVLFYWEDMPTREIGEVMDLSITAVTTRLSRAREKLRETIEALEVDPQVRRSLLEDLDGWARSVGGGRAPAAGGR